MNSPAPEIKRTIDLGFTPDASGVLTRVGGKGVRGPVVHQGRTTWRATRTKDGPATVAISADGHSVRVAAWGSGAEIASDNVPDLLGMSDEPHKLEPKDALVSRLVTTRPNYRMTKTNSIWEHVITTVLGQKVPVASASASWQGMLARWGETPPGAPHPCLRLGPAAEVVADLGYHDLHRVNVERERADVVLMAAKRAFRLEEALMMSPADARRRLEAIRGIGPWTSSIITQLALGDPDAVITGDYNIPAMIAWNFAHERTADDERMLEILEPYIGQRARVQNLVKFGGSRPPRHGPRLSLTDLSGR